MPERGGDEAIAALGVHRIPVPIPFPQAGGPVNVIAVEEEGGGIALFDSSLGYDESETVLIEGLAARGFDYSDVRRIIITHGHIDHYGLVQKIRAISGAPVWVHPRDRAKVMAPVHWVKDRPLYDEYLIRCGADLKSIDEMMQIAAFQELLGLRVEEPIGDLAEGQELRFAHCDATLLEMPGHTPGLVCALLRPRGEQRPGAPASVLLANDHLLEKVSPNPLLGILPDGSRFSALPNYFKSVARARGLDLDWVVPGHGACFQNHRPIIDALGAFYGRRQAKLVANIPPEGATPIDLVFSIFPKATPLDTFLMIGEILGNLDLLEEQQRVGTVENRGVIRYYRR